jgi:RNA polymerase-binding transcription factor DksA
MDTSFYTDVEAKLLDTRTDWERRLEAILADRRRQSDLLDRDLEDQAIQRENDATLDALDARGRQELEAVAAALERLATGNFGRCVQCGTSISTDRLRVQPIAETCLSCARAETNS